VTPTPPAPAEVKIDLIKLDQFDAKIKEHRGKVVVVDFWADFCAPCKEEFPHLVRLHNTYAKDGLVCMSVSVDVADENGSHDEARAACLKFLKEQKATFANFLVDEETGVWQDKWGFAAPPAVMVYDRQGNKRLFDNSDPNNQFDYEKDVEPHVKKVLAEKP
jgi:thiol-disulfide isomerase/thioredoxin